ncbi:MAG: hypothetical protein AAGI71_07375 [Bacteroidota bacterium]
MPRSHSIRLGATLGVFLLLLHAGCEADVSPLVGEDRYYSLYGVLNPRTDTQTVVVFPIESTLRTLPEESLDARFTSVEQETGQTVVWQDSILSTEQGAVHVFWAPFQAQFGSAYELNVERSDGATSSVSLQVPPEAAFEIGPATLGPPVTQTVFVRPDVERLAQVRVTYVVRALIPPNIFRGSPDLIADERPPGGPGTGPPPPPDSLVVQTANARFDYTEFADLGGSEWALEIDLGGDFREIRDAIRARARFDLGYGIQIDGIFLSVVVANEAWNPPGGTFDPDVLIQPGTMSNVEQGFGFVGAGYPMEIFWLPPQDILERAGFSFTDLPTDPPDDDGPNPDDPS